jgi:hypothetical protein
MGTGSPGCRGAHGKPVLRQPLEVEASRPWCWKWRTKLATDGTGTGREVVWASQRWVWGGARCRIQLRIAARRGSEELHQLPSDRRQTGAGTLAALRSPHAKKTQPKSCGGTPSGALRALGGVRAWSQYKFEKARAGTRPLRRRTRPRPSAPGGSCIRFQVDSRLRGHGLWRRDCLLTAGSQCYLL